MDLLQYVAAWWEQGCPPWVLAALRMFVAGSDSPPVDFDHAELRRKLAHVHKHAFETYKTLNQTKKTVGPMRFKQMKENDEYMLCRCKLEVSESIFVGIDKYYGDAPAGEMTPRDTHALEEALDACIPAASLVKLCTTESMPYYRFFMRNVASAKKGSKWNLKSIGAKNNDLVALYKSFCYDFPRFLLATYMAAQTAFVHLHACREGPQSITLFTDICLEKAFDALSSAFKNQDQTEKLTIYWIRLVWMPTLMASLALHTRGLRAHSFEAHDKLYRDYCAWRKESWVEIAVDVPCIA